MHKKILIFPLIVFSCVMSFLPQGDSVLAQCVEWQRTYGGSGEDIGSTVPLTSDGGYIIACYTDSFSAGRSCIWLIKTDSFGNIQWDSTYCYDTSIGMQQHLPWVDQTADGGYIVTGASDYLWSESSELVLIKTDSLGDIECDTTFGGANYEGGCWVGQTSDRGYIVGGLTFSSFGGGGPHIWIIKTDSSYSIECSLTCADNGGRMLQTLDDSYILIGEAGLDGYVSKITSQCSTIWERTFQKYGCESFCDVDSTSDDGYVLVGGTAINYPPNDKVWLIKIDSLGIKEWDTTYGGMASRQDAVFVER